jgi:hypothetical protein
MPGEKDFAVGAVGQQPGPSGAVYAGGFAAGSSINKKPRYLITLESVSKAGKNSVRYFIAIDKPDHTTGFVQVKGFYSDATEDEIVSSFADLIGETPKESIMEIMFPTHKIHSIRSLVFNANKQTSLVK